MSETETDREAECNNSRIKERRMTIANTNTALTPTTPTIQINAAISIKKTDKHTHSAVRPRISSNKNHLSKLRVIF